MLLPFIEFNAARLYCDIHTTWYQSDYLLDTLYHVISILQFSSVPAFALLTRLRFCWNHFLPEPPVNISRPFDMTFIINRVQVIRNASKRFQDSLRLRKLLFFLLLPIFMSSYNTYSDAKIFKNCTVTDNKHSSDLRYFSSVMTILYYLHYGCFWYLVYIQRVSLHCQLNQAIKNIRGAAKMDSCNYARTLIDGTYMEFHAIRSTVGLWMAFILFTDAILVSCSLIFNFQQGISENEPDNIKKCYTSCMVRLWSENVMFLVLPLAAVGGANLERYWQLFRHVIIRSKAEANLQFWILVEKYTVDIDGLGKLELTWTIMFPVVGAFLSYALANQTHLDFHDPWYHCGNMVNETETASWC